MPTSIGVGLLFQKEVNGKMQVCIVYAGKSSQDASLKEICSQFQRGLESQGHNVDIFNMYTDTDRKLSFYDYIIVGTVATSLFGGSIPPTVKQFLARAGQISGKRCLAFVTKAGLRQMKTLSSLMRTMEGEGMYLKYSEVIKKPSSALALGKRINVERNF